MNVKEVIGRLGGRKWIAALIALLAISVSGWFGMEIDPKKLDAATNILAAFLIGQGVADGLSGGRTSTSAQPSSTDAG